MYLRCVKHTKCIYAFFFGSNKRWQVIPVYYGGRDDRLRNNRVGVNFVRMITAWIDRRGWLKKLPWWLWNHAMNLWKIDKRAYLRRSHKSSIPAWLLKWRLNGEDNETSSTVLPRFNILYYVGFILRRGSQLRGVLFDFGRIKMTKATSLNATEPVLTSVFGTQNKSVSGS